MPRAFLGAGWGFPVQLADGSRAMDGAPGSSQAAPAPRGGERTLGRPGGVLEAAAHEESVRQSVWIILGTAKGERVMRPEFGCDIYDQVFALNDATAAGRLAQAVRTALLAFEPRIDLVDVQVRPEGEVMLLNVDYRVRATNNAFNLVYPFYLEGAGI